MNIKRAKEEIKNTIAAYLARDEYGAYAIPVIRQRPVLLIGPPGIGKTQIMEQISRECRIGLVAYTITHHTRQSAIGLPYITEKVYDGVRMSVTEYTMSEIVASIYDKIEATGLREGILFIDEINCVSETLAPAMLQFLQAKTFGSHKIPEGWIIVAAGNPPEYNKSVRDFDVVTLDRIKMIEVEADYSVWKEYAESVNIHPAITAYLNVKQENFCRIETTVDGKRFATPRGWEDLSRLIEVYERLNMNVDRDVVAQYIQHPAIAKDFANYLELYYKYENDYRVDEIVSGVIREGVCDKLAKAPFDERLSVVSLLLARLNGGFRAAADMEDRLERLQGIFAEMKPAASAAGGKTEAEASCVTAGRAEMEEMTAGTSSEAAGGAGTGEMTGDGKTAASAGRGTDRSASGRGTGTYASALEHLESLAAGVTAERKYKQEAGLLSRREDHISRDVGKVLDETVQSLKADHLQEEEPVWQRIQEIFERENAAYEAHFENCARMLEHVFDFLEAAFGTGQELVIFVTSLNTGFYSVRFLQQYECERYFRYNKTLLFDAEERDILSRISNRNA